MARPARRLSPSRAEGGGEDGGEGELVGFGRWGDLRKVEAEVHAEFTTVRRVHAVSARTGVFTRALKLHSESNHRVQRGLAILRVPTESILESIHRTRSRTTLRKPPTDQEPADAKSKAARRPVFGR